MRQAPAQTLGSASVCGPSEGVVRQARCAILKLWPTACLMAGFVALAALLVLGTRANGSLNAAGYRTPLASSFGLLYSVPVIVALILFRAGKFKRFSWRLSAVLCLLVIACGALQGVVGGSRSIAVYVACFVEIGCLSVWCLLARDMPTPGDLMEWCVAVALSCLIACALLTAGYMAAARVGLPILSIVLPIAMHAVLCRYGRPLQAVSSEHPSGPMGPCPTDVRARVASVGLGLAFSCGFSLLFRVWLNKEALTILIPILVSCACLAAVGLLALLRGRASVCLVVPPLFCGAAVLMGAFAHVESQSLCVIQLTLFACGLTCAVCVLMSVLPSFCADGGSSCMNSLAMRLVLVAVASCFAAPTLEVAGALLGDTDFLGHAVLVAMLAYGASCCWLCVADAKPSTPSARGEAEPSAVRLVAREYGLTARQTDVLEELFNGRTAPYIARDLSVSINTVRSHAKTIYAKLAVHSQQELIDLIEADVAQQKSPLHQRE